MNPVTLVVVFVYTIGVVLFLGMMHLIDARRLARQEVVQPLWVNFALSLVWPLALVWLWTTDLIWELDDVGEDLG